MRLMVLALLVCWTALLSGCRHAPGDPPNPVLRPDEVSDFATLYKQNCAACHGANGQNGSVVRVSFGGLNESVDNLDIATFF